MPPKVLSNVYVVMNRFVLRAKIFLHDDCLVVKILPKIGHVLTSMKGALSKRELEMLIKSLPDFPQLIIKKNSIQEIDHELLRRGRSDVAKLFDTDEVRGNIYRVTIRYSDENYLRLILPQGDLVKLKNYVLRG
ncbi:MAG: hypothetical protein J7J20_07410 [Desulfurococcales archaeon]|nr:hypothetical protein [Desulfurococcales archaeon]